MGKKNTEAPYADAGRWLVSEVGRLIQETGKMHNSVDMADILKVKSSNTIREWLAGRRKPNRDHAAHMAENLGIKDSKGDPDYALLMKMWGHQKLSDRSPASAPELILYLKYNKPREWSQAQAQMIARALARVDNAPEEWQATIATILANQRAPLIRRAVQVAQVIATIDQGAMQESA